MNHVIRGVAASVALAASSLAPDLAHAHARYESSTPAAGASVATAPPQVRVCYSDSLETSGTYLQVVDSSSNRVDQNNSQIDAASGRRCMAVGVQTLSPGVYTVRWRVVSTSDGHADEASFQFAVTGGQTGLAPAPASGVSEAGAPSPQAAAAQAADLAAAQACWYGIAQTMVPVTQQMVQFGAATPSYPVAPNGRPILGPPPAYPGFQALYGPQGTPYWQLANGYGAQALNAVPLQPQFRRPVLTPNQPNGHLHYSEYAAAAFAANNQRLGIVGNNLAAANFNTRLTGFPLEVANGFKEVLEGLTSYGLAACAGTTGSAGAASGGHSHGHGHGGNRFSELDIPGGPGGGGGGGDGHSHSH